jgi:branched-chain amino acid aminotransferase
LNGQLVEVEKAAISPFDHGLLTGDGIFETLISYRGEPFAHTRHYRRLTEAAQRLGLKVPAHDLFVGALREVIQASGLEHARLRFTVTGGEGPLGSGRGASKQTLLAAASPVPDFPAVANVVTVPYPRNERGALAGIKTVSYAENVMALHFAKERGGDEAIFGNLAANLCEGTGTNIFVVRDGKLITPPVSSGCLSGITRSVLLDLCRDQGIPVEETDIPLADLDRADEAFLTSTLREIQPVGKVNGTSLGQVPGPMAERLAAAFKDFVARELDP